MRISGMRTLVSALLVFCAVNFAHAQDGGVPKPQEGVVIGTVTAKAADWIDVKLDATKKIERYKPFWMDGSSAGSGNYDMGAVKELRAIPVGSRVEIFWKMEDCLRIVSIKVLPREKKEEAKKGGK